MPRKARPMSRPSSSLLYPIQSLDLGDPEKDPCFGKLVDLTAPECQSCGDVEFCQIAFSLLHKKKILKEEKEGNNLDLEFSQGLMVKDIRDTYSKLLEGGEGKMRAYKKTSMKFKVKMSYVKEVVNESK